MTMTQAPGRGRWQAVHQPAVLELGWGAEGACVCVCGGVVGGPGPPTQQVAAQKLLSTVAVPRTAGHSWQSLMGALTCLVACITSHRNCSVSGEGSACGLGTVRNFRHHFPPYGNTSPNIIFLKHTHPLHVHFIENHIFIYICMSIF